MKIRKIDIMNIAQVAHEANREYCAQHGDESHKPWKETPRSIQDTTITGVVKVIEGDIRSPEESHQSWMWDKTKAGYVYGAEKDNELRTHPNLRPYNELPTHERMKDHIFFAIVKAMKTFIEYEKEPSAPTSNS